METQLKAVCSQAHKQALPLQTQLLIKTQVSFAPPNLNPDMETALGTWNINQLVQMVRMGTRDHSARSIDVMPWRAHANIISPDALAIAAYLKSLAPVHNEVPRNVSKGQKLQLSLFILVSTKVNGNFTEKHSMCV
ncbi:MAG: hypothetical protein ACJA2Q_002766 [Pseudohongiellaceae bacterium]